MEIKICKSCKKEFNPNKNKAKIDEKKELGYFNKKNEKA